MEFGTFRFEPRSERLLRGDKNLPLRPKTMAVLVYFLRREGVLVTREELLEAVWPGATVSDDSLTQTITELRRVLRDDARKPRYIQTAHGRGFRFVARVQEVSNDEAPAPAASATFVGRTRELEHLNRALQSAGQGQRQLVLVSGEAGAGKSELVHAFLAGAHEHCGQDPVVARGQCVGQFGQREPYLPLIDALAHVLRSPAEPAVRVSLRRHAPTWAARLPQTRERGRRQGTTEVTQTRSLRELTAALEAVASDRVVIVVLEDLHWADPSTIDLMTFAAMREQHARLFIVGTFRPAEAAVAAHPITRVAGMLVGRHAFGHLELGGLSTSDVQRYLDVRCAELNRDDAADWMHGRTGGNALMVAAMTDHMLRELREKGVQPFASTAWRREIPGDISAIIEHQVGSLHADARRLLDAACVAGFQFDAQEIVAAIDGDEEGVEECCGQLDRHHGLLRVLPSQEWPDGSIGVRYTFRHDLFRQWLYDRLPPVGKRSLHERIGRRLEAGFGQSATAPVLAQIAGHFECGGDRGRAIEHLRAAAVRALGSGALREARQYIEAALPQLDRLAAGVERGPLELALLQVLASVEAGAGGYSAITLDELLLRIVELAREAGDLAAELEARYAIWQAHGTRGSVAHIEESLQHLREVAARTGETGKALCMYATASTQNWSGRFADARESLRMFAEVSRESAEAVFPVSPRYGLNPYLGGLLHLSFANFAGGNAELARRYRGEAVELALRIGNPDAVANILAQSALIAWLLGDRRDAAELAVRARKFADEQGLEFWSALAEMIDGAGTAYLRTDEGIETFQNGMRRASGMRLGLSGPFHVIFVTVCLENGRTDLGLSGIARALEVSRPSFDRFLEAEMWRLRGELTMVAGRGESDEGTRQGRLEQAASDMRLALQIARSQDAALFELRAALGLAMVRRWQGRSDGLSELQAALGRVPAGGSALPEVARAQALLGHGHAGSGPGT